MANPGVPPGGARYPSKAEINNQLGNILGGPDQNTDLSSLQPGDRRLSYWKSAGRIFNDQVVDNTTGQYLNQTDQILNYRNAGKFYNPDQYEYGTATQEDIDNAVNGAKPGFIQWDVPTSSTNYARPRTVAAGYTPDPKDPNNGTMTVVFRDGTFYNYYQVSQSEWSAFYASYSKGSPWLNKGFPSGKQQTDGLFINKPRGIATDMDTMDPAIRQALYRVAVTQQMKQKPKKGRTSQTLFSSGGEYGLKGTKGAEKLSVPNRVGRGPAAMRGGKNPATANRQKKAS
jgi:hypothetical protein